MPDINIDEYLEDLQTYLDNGEEEKMYWQEDMQVLISELKETRKQLEKLENKNKDLLRKLRNRVKEVKKLTKYSLYKKEFLRLNKIIEKKDKIIDLMACTIYDYANLGKLGICDCELEDGRIDIKLCNQTLADRNCNNCIKQYFERKVEK